MDEAGTQSGSVAAPPPGPGHAPDHAFEHPATPGHGEWPLRPWVTAALMGTALAAAWVIAEPAAPYPEQSPWRAALTSGLVFAALLASFTLAPGRWRGPALFSALTGAVVGGIAWRVARAGEHYVDAPFWMAAGVLAGALALPLYQAGFHRRRWATPYRETHFHVWTDAISAGGAVAFTGLAWLLLFLVAGLFEAIEIDALMDLVDDGWFGWTFTGAAFGAALGTLRNTVGVLGTLQRVVMLVFAILAVPLAAALALFLVAVALSGPDVLWRATGSATPMLLSAAVGAFVLANAVLRDSDAEMSPSRIQRAAAAVLALGVLPLALLAAVSMGARIAQHGLSPERLWALVMVVVAVAYGIGYAVAAVRARRHGWDSLRRTNLHLAVATCALALLLALPLLDFGAIAARDQLARLARGAVSEKDFDYEALRWDFGDAGRAALARLAKGPGEAGRRAREQLARKQATRWAPPAVEPRKIVFDNPDPALKAKVLRHLETNSWLCEGGCYVLDLGMTDKGRKVAIVAASQVELVVLTASGPSVVGYPGSDEPGYKPGDTVTVGTVARRYVMVNGKPVGEPID